MRRLLGLLVAVISVAALPAPADAQVYPERIVLKEKARLVTGAYQRRNQDGREEQTERTTRTIRLGSDGLLELGNIAGDITVTRGSGADTTVEILKIAHGRDTADAKEMLQLVQVDVTERSGRAEVKARYPGGDMSRRNNRRNVNVSVEYKVTTPAGTRLTIESISGSVKVADIKGELTANSVSGDIRITGGGRVGSAKTISGSVEVDEAQVDALEAGSVSGDVVLRRVKSRRIDAGSVSGDIKLDDVQADRVEAHTTSGSATFSGPLARNGRYELKTFSGDVHVFVPASSGFEVDANSFSGEVRSDGLPITMRGTSDGRGGRRKILHGTYGDGSAILDLTTFSGSIVISKR